MDLGHFFAGNNTSPVPFITQYHERVTKLIRDNKWNIQATIEFEYKVPAGSDRMTELARAIKYCRDALA